ncbi:serine/threonine protein kinase [Helicocarpus griseus UAMH5409]|uniref:non-specific serine/threonine protein kinase n=1 Tax=Helicocarpus griseus UAMH5409 TaxID=1447875 RepID=A0A2B7XTW4_9EURO|nr:serine/threonine protein kinase [Helicocarpus griseus UAMH5409]
MEFAQLAEDPAKWDRLGYYSVFVISAEDLSPDYCPPFGHRLLKEMYLILEANLADSNVRIFPMEVFGVAWPAHFTKNGKPSGVATAPISVEQAESLKTRKLTRSFHYRGRPMISMPNSLHGDLAPVKQSSEQQSSPEEWEEVVNEAAMIMERNVQLVNQVGEVSKGISYEGCVTDIQDLAREQEPKLYSLALKTPIITGSSTMGPVSQSISSFSSREEDQHPDYDPKTRLGFQLYSVVGKGHKPVSPAIAFNGLLNNNGKAEKSAYEEAEISRHISQVRSSHEGRAYVRLVEESFKIQSPLGDHICLVFEPLREPLWALGRHLGGVCVPLAVLKPFLKLFLEGLDFLHSECHVIHTDLKEDNFLVGFEDSTVVESYVRQQEDDPAPFKVSNGRPIYQSQYDFGPLKKGVGIARISDSSTAVYGNVSVPHNHDIQPLPFCAPEVLLKATWTYSADIWNVGTMLWELLNDATIFDGRDPRDNSYLEKRTWPR